MVELELVHIKPCDRHLARETLTIEVVGFVKGDFFARKTERIL